MPARCSANRFDFARVAGRALSLTRRLAACFKDRRDPAYTEHAVETLVMQRVVGIALGYEDLIDHDQLRHDPVLAVLAGKLAARRTDCAPLAGKSTLNQLELSQTDPTRYHKFAAETDAIEALFVDPVSGRLCQGAGADYAGSRRHG